jgi:hypothetical protein
METRMGRRVVELLRDHLSIDEEWMVEDDEGFTWWPHRHAQRIWAEAPVEQMGIVAQRVNVETDLAHGDNVLDPSFELVLMLPFADASLAGPVVVEDTVRLRSSAVVTEDNADWTGRLLQMASAIQLVNAEVRAGDLLSAMELSESVSAHPTNGARAEPDEMLHVLDDLPEREGVSAWLGCEEMSAIPTMMSERGLPATGDEIAFTVELPFGDRGGSAVTGGDSHLLQVTTDPHPSLGAGVRVRLRLRRWPREPDGRLLLPVSLNGWERDQPPGPHLLGSWAADPPTVDPDATPYFTCFVPNITFAPGILTNLVLSMGVRAQSVAELIDPSRPGA